MGLGAMYVSTESGGLPPTGTFSGGGPNPGEEDASGVTGSGLLLLLTSTSTDTTAATATPFLRAGSKRQILTVRIALSSKSGVRPLRTETSLTSPSGPTVTLSTSVPLMLVLRAASV